MVTGKRSTLLASDYLDNSNLDNFSLASLAHASDVELGTDAGSHLVEYSERKFHFFRRYSNSFTIVMDSYDVEGFPTALLESELHLGRQLDDSVLSSVAEQVLVLSVPSVILRMQVFHH